MTRITEAGITEAPVNKCYRWEDVDKVLQTKAGVFALVWIGKLATQHSLPLLGEDTFVELQFNRSGYSSDPRLSSAPERVILINFFSLLKEQCERMNSQRQGSLPASEHLKRLTEVSEYVASRNQIGVDRAQQLGEVLFSTVRRTIDDCGSDIGGMSLLRRIRRNPLEFQRVLKMERIPTNQGWSFEDPREKANNFFFQLNYGFCNFDDLDCPFL